MSDDTHAAAEAPRRRRTGGREGRAAARLASVAESVPFITRALTPFEVLSEEGLATIEHNADTILEQVGIDFREAPDALALLAGAGCDVDGERVRFPRGLARQLVQATAPREFTRSPATPPTTWRSAARRPCSRPHTARRSCATSTRAVATARSRTSATS